MNIEALIKESVFQFVRSSGAGGQHVNKVSTKVILRFDIPNSKYLSPEEKEKISTYVSHKISKDGILILSSAATRSQLKNKELVITKFRKLLHNALIPTKKRKPTKRPHSAHLKRLIKKKNQAQKKVNRQKPQWE